MNHLKYFESINGSDIFSDLYYSEESNINLISDLFNNLSDQGYEIKICCSLTFENVVSSAPIFEILPSRKENQRINVSKINDCDHGRRRIIKELSFEELKNCIRYELEIDIPKFSKIPIHSNFEIEIKEYCDSLKSMMDLNKFSTQYFDRNSWCLISFNLINNI